MVTHVPVVKSGLKPINIQKEREKIALMSAEKLTVSQVEMLSGREPRQVEIHSMLRGPITVGDGGVMSARSPQVAIISPMLSGGGEMQHTVEGKGSSAGGSVDAKKHTSTVVIDLSQDDEEDSRKTDTRREEVMLQGSGVAGVRVVPQIVGRKILMSSGRPLDPVSHVSLQYMKA